MKICLCIDKEKGVMFFGKRQSRDRIQRDEMLKLVGKNKLWMSSYSAPLFEGADNVIVDDEFLTRAPTGDYCFIEGQDFDLSLCEAVIVYNWNRHYPADKFFPYDLKKEGFKLVSKRSFVGSSHEKITEEIYERRATQ